MKYYLRFLFIAAFWGILNFIFTMHGDSMAFSSIVLDGGFGNTVLVISDAGNFFLWYFPLLFFHVFFGTYIYRHFCSACIYFFSRCCNRTLWFLKECGILYVFSLLYLVILIVSGTLTVKLQTTVTFDKESFVILVYYLLIHSLFLFFTTLCINLLAILISSSDGFIYVEGILLFCIATFFVTGQEYYHSMPAASSHQGLIKWNPISHIIFSIHSSSIASVDKLINRNGLDFDLNTSIAVYAILILFAVIGGVIAVNKYNFMDSNQENGG